MKIAKWWRKIDGYIEFQFVDILLIFSAIWIVGLIFADLFFKIYDLYNTFVGTIYLPSVLILTIIKIVTALKEKGIDGFLMISYLRNFNMKYLSIYIEAGITAFLFFLTLIYISEVLNDFGIIVALLIAFRIYISIIRNSLGKILLNKKVMAMNKGYNFHVDIQDKVYLDTFHLIEDLRSSVIESMEEKIKSERMKTELITNISHDIKTPLTTIINYINLMKYEDDPQEKARYLETVDNNSTRLKSMIVDLIYASKTGTGNIELKPYNIELNELINQVYGQFDDKFVAKDLDFVYRSSASKIPLRIDGDQLSRVFENLFSNIVKYSKEGTRVYGKSEVLDDRVDIQLNNISKDALNISPDELMAQFVRGERARHSEGSGLGLYIVRNLVELLGGEFNIYINGDLFTAMIRFYIKINRKNSKKDNS
ncbi:MAG: HAMP domain-containing sensor histidine kinase [Tissierellia bacterium]|nr:HAMP domain-containing sensor histidine kinase [Tissierellia bacterium]